VTLYSANFWAEPVSGAWAERKTERSRPKTDLSGAERWAGLP